MKAKTRNRLRVVRAERRVTQLQLAQKAGLSGARYWQIENEEGPVVRPEERAAIAKALRLDEGDLWPQGKAVA